MSSSTYDFIFLGIILFSSLFGLVRGAVSEALSLLSWIVAIWVFKHFSPIFNSYLSEYISNPVICNIVVFLIILTALALIATLFKFTFSRAIRAIGLSGLNHILGFVFGVIRGIIICAIIVIAIELLGFDSAHSWQNAKTAKIIAPAISIIQKATNNIDLNKFTSPN